MHLRVRALQVLIEFFLLVIAQDFADLPVGIHAQRPNLTQELFARRALDARLRKVCRQNGQNRRIRALLMNGNDDARRSKEHIRGNRFN
jgi:hypothetical protein